MTPLDYFLSELNIYPSVDTDNIEPDYIKDDSQYIIVDGEEGDYGIIKYYVFINDVRIHVCDYINKGGDDLWYEYTEAGRDIFGGITKQIIEKRLTQIRTI